jgi:hypothetical protein
MTEEFAFQLWIGFTLCVTILILLIRFSRTSNWHLNLIEALDVAFTCGGATSSFYVFSKIWSVRTQLLVLVGRPGLIMITLGCAIPINLAIIECASYYEA